MAFPTLRLFKHGEVFAPDYRGDRTVTALLEYAKSKLDLEEKMKDWHPSRRERIIEQHKEHPGCLLYGHLLVNRVPGNFHIEVTDHNSPCAHNDRLLRPAKDLCDEVLDPHPLTRLSVHGFCSMCDFQARSNQHNLNAQMTNLSHIVNHLSFGKPIEVKQKKKLARFASFDSSAPLDGRDYINDAFHQSYHHFTKVGGKPRYTQSN